MANFEINDKVAFVRKSTNGLTIYETLLTGTVIDGPMMIDEINHYQIKWDKTISNQYPGSSEIELISTVDSKKYGYRKIN